MNISTHIVSLRKPHSHPRRGIGCWRRLLAAGLTLGVAAVLQTSRADSVIYDNNFDNATNNLANNDHGVGGGFSRYTRGGFDVYEASGSAYIATSFADFNMASIDTLSPISLSGGGTTIEFKGVTFSTNTPNPNLAATTTDRLFLGVTTTNGAGNWYAGASVGMPPGFWIQIMSDSIPNGTGSGSWTGTSTLFYKNVSTTNLYTLATWRFDTLKWSAAGPNNFTPTLDIKLTLTGTGWAINITGDTASSQAINFSGTYAGSGFVGGNPTIVGFTNEMINGLNNTYIGAYNQCANPPINMGIDEVKAFQVGTLAVTTPTFSTPEYDANVNTVLAGEAVTLISSVTDSVATPTLSWQLENLATPGTFTNLPSGTATNVSVNTTGLGDSLTRGIRLIATDGGLSVTSAVVKLTVNPASAPSLAQDVTPPFLNLYNGQGGAFTAIFSGNKPFSYQWQHCGPLETTLTNIPNATNATLLIASAVQANEGYYQIQVSNSQGANSSGYGYVNIVPGTPAIVWSLPVPFGGLNADQILTNFPSANKIAGAMFATNGGLPLVVTTSRGNIAFGPSGDASVPFFSSATVSGGSGFGSGAFDSNLIGASTNRTGNTVFDGCLNDYHYNGPSHLITLSGLIVGQQYQVQLFGLDDRNKTWLSNWQDPSNQYDISLSFKMGDDVYTLGTFTASNTVQTIQQNLGGNGGTNGNFNCLILRTVGWNPPPYWVYQPQNLGNFAGFNTSITGIAAGDSTIPNPTITYQWKAGPVGGPYTNLTEGAKYNGTTTTTLTISNLDFPDGVPVYVLAATNGGGGLFSREAVLSVQGAPPGLVNGSYAAYALSNNPAGLWMLFETNNTAGGTVLAYDSSGNGKHALYGSASQNGFNGIQGPQPPSYTGFYTNEPAMKTTTGNVNGYVVLPSLNFTNLEVTYALWINPVANSAFTGLLYARNTLGGLGNGGDQIGGFGYSNAGGVLGYNWNDNALTYNYSSGLVPVVGQWNFVALVIEADKATFYQYYINSAGQPVLLKAINPVPNTAVVKYSGGYIFLGNDSYDTVVPPRLNQRVFNGSMAGAGIYNHALTESQLQKLFAAGVGISSDFAPGFAQQPSDAGAFPNTTVQFRTVTSGTAPVTNQWTINGTNLVDGAYGSSTITGAKSNVLTIANVGPINAGVYNLILSNKVASLVSSNATLAILTPTLVGEWLSGTQTFADVSGFSPAGKHDAYLYTGSTIWTNDVPPGAPPGSYALYFAAAGLEVSNSAATDPGYKNTFDSAINSGMTVMCWAKGWPANWGPFLSKYGDNGIGWQLRVNNSTNFSCWTTRNASGGGDLSSTYFSNDGKWHHYAGTFDPGSGVRFLYVDGVQVARSTGNGAINPATGANASHVEIGARDNAGNRQVFYTGTIYDVRIYDYAMPQHQIVGASKGLGVNVAQNVYVTPASTRTFTTPGIAAYPPYTGYRWQLNTGGGFGNLSDGALAGATISGSGTTSLTITGITAGNAGLYQLLVTNAVGVTTNGIVNLTVLPATMLGHWLTGSQSLTDTAGYAPAGTHDSGLVVTNGVAVGAVGWSTDVPTIAPGGSYSLSLTNAGLIVSNSAAYEAGYVNTFDDKTLNGMTVFCWAKGWPSAWNPFVSKYGEGPGWQVRNDGNNNVSPCWSLRWGGGTVALGLAVFGNAEDLAATSLTYGNDGLWHNYAATYDLTTGSRIFYVDGVLVARVTGQGQYGPSAFSHLMIGAKESGGNALDQHTAGYGNYFTGKIYDVRVYDYGLSQNTVRALIGLPPLTPAFNGNPVLSGNKLVLSWSNGTLNSSTNVAGPYSAVAGATSPYTNVIQSTVPNLFFKVSNP